LLAKVSRRLLSDGFDDIRLCLAQVQPRADGCGTQLYEAILLHQHLRQPDVSAAVGTFDQGPHGVCGGHRFALIAVPRDVRRAAAEAEVFRLDRKPLVFQVFAMLAEATR